MCVCGWVLLRVNLIYLFAEDGQKVKLRHKYRITKTNCLKIVGEKRGGVRRGYGEGNRRREPWESNREEERDSHAPVFQIS